MKQATTRRPIQTKKEYTYSQPKEKIEVWKETPLQILAIKPCFCIKEIESQSFLFIQSISITFGNTKISS